VAYTHMAEPALHDHHRLRTSLTTTLHITKRPRLDMAASRR
jgi:hypothetical protein